MQPYTPLMYICQTFFFKRCKLRWEAELEDWYLLTIYWHSFLAPYHFLSYLSILCILSPLCLSTSVKETYIPVFMCSPAEKHDYILGFGCRRVCESLSDGWGQKNRRHTDIRAPEGTARDPILTFRQDTSWRLQSDFYSLLIKPSRSHRDP